MLIAIVEGVEGGERIFRLGSADSVKASVLSALGVPLDVTADTVTLEFYDYADRRNASSQSVALAVTTALAGYVLASITATTLTLARGVYYMYVKRIENVGSTVLFSRKYIKVTVK